VGPREKWDEEVRMTWPSVPVIVDSVKHEEGFEMTRCMFFAVEVEDLIVEGGSQFGDVPASLYLHAGSGVILGPAGQQRGFESVDEVNAIFDGIERIDGLTVGSGDVWVPNTAFGVTDRGPKRGDVFRLNVPLFRMCHRYQRDLISQEELEAQGLPEAVMPQIEVEGRETSVFSQWMHRQIDEVRKVHHSDARFAGKEKKPKPPRPPGKVKNAKRKKKGAKKKAARKRKLKGGRGRKP